MKLSHECLKIRKWFNALFKYYNSFKLHGTGTHDEVQRELEGLLAGLGGARREERHLEVLLQRQDGAQRVAAEHARRQVPREEAGGRVLEGGHLGHQGHLVREHAQDHPQRSHALTQDKERSTFYFGDLPPADNRAFKKKERTEKEIEEDTARFDEARKLRQNTKKEEIEKLHNQNIPKIQENAKKRQSFRFWRRVMSHNSNNGDH